MSDSTEYADDRPSRGTIRVKCVAEYREESCNNAEDCKHEVACEAGCEWTGTVAVDRSFGLTTWEFDCCPECGGEIVEATNDK